MSRAIAVKLCPSCAETFLSDRPALIAAVAKAF
jgi:hypothetical protein